MDAASPTSRALLTVVDSLCQLGIASCVVVPSATATVRPMLRAFANTAYVEGQHLYLHEACRQGRATRIVEATTLLPKWFR